MTDRVRVDIDLEDWRRVAWTRRRYRMALERILELVTSDPDRDASYLGNIADEALNPEAFQQFRESEVGRRIAEIAKES